MTFTNLAQSGYCSSAQPVQRLGFLTLVLLTSVVGSAHARPPEIRSVNVRGLQVGQPTVVTIDGVELLPAPKLLLGANVVQATLDDKQSNANRIVLTATLPNETTPGLAQLRLVTNEGISNSVVVALDRLPQLPISETVTALPVSLHGSVPGSGSSKTSFAGKAGDEVLIEVEAKRLGSKLRPVVHLFDAQRTQVAWAMPSRTLAGDCRLSAKLPRDGQYTVELHDQQYAPPGVSFFRLKIGQWQFADLAFPPAVARGQEVELELLGSAVGWDSVPTRSTNRLKLPFKAVGNSDVIPLLLPNPQAFSGAPPSVLLSSLPELVEANVAMGGSPVANHASSTGEPPVATIPVAVSGRLDAPGQLDQYRFTVTPGMKLAFEVFAERLGSRIDAVLEIRNKDSGVLAANDDGPDSTDPRLEFTVPANLDTIVVALRDSLDIANEQAIYRLVVLPSDKSPPEISVTAKADVANIASGESQVLEVHVTRKGYDGPLQLSLGQLPAGVTATGTEITAGASGTLLTLTNDGSRTRESSDGSPATSATELVTSLTAKSPDGTVSARVRTAAAADDRTPVWLRESFGIAATSKPTTPFQVAWADAQPMSQLVLMSKTALPVKFVRPSGMLGPIRLTFVTSQLEPRVNNQPNPTLAVRPERVVEVPVDPPVQAAINALKAIDTQLAEAMKQATVAQGDAKTAADAKVTELTTKKTAAEAAVRDAEAKANSASELALIVPSVLPESSCDISIKAELLNPERNIVLRTAYSTVRRLPVLNPLAVKLTGSTTIEQQLDPKTGAVVKLTGKIERLANFKGDVNLMLTGQPGGVAITNAAVKADQTDFALELRFPASFAAGEVKGIKLIATGPPDPQTGNQPIRTEVDLMVKLTPGS